MATSRYWHLSRVPDDPLLTPDREQYLRHRSTYDATKKPGLIRGWQPIDLSLPRDTELLDHQGTLYRFTVCSERFRKVVEGHLSPDDEVQWLPVVVVGASTVHRAWVLQPLDGTEALAADRSTYGAQGVGLVKAVFDGSVARKHEVLKYPYGPGSVFSERLRDALGSAGCSGLHWEQVPLS